MLTARRAALAVVPLLLAGCGGGEPPAEAPGPWVRIDLWRRPPEVELRSGPGTPWAAEPGWLAGGAAAAPPAAGRVRLLTQRAGSRLAWTLDLPPAEPYLTLRPLGAPGGDCPCLQRVGVRDADGIVHELYRGHAPRSPRPAPAAVELDLAPFAGTRVELLLQVDLSDPSTSPTARAPRVAWASPAVYGRLEPGADPAPWDRPATGAAAADTRRASGPSGRPANVLLLTLGSVGADAVGPRGHRPSPTPTLDALAAEADAWDAASAASAVTVPSVASILTGLTPRHHGAHDGAPLAAGRATLADRFAAAGYATAAALADPRLAAAGLPRGFAEIVAADSDAAELLADRAIDWLAGRDAPWFLWLHFADPRPPHAPPQPYALGFRPAGPAGLAAVPAWLPFRPPSPVDPADPALRAELHAAEIAYLDRHLGRILDFLASRAALDHTIVALTADHGHTLPEPGDPTRVPLLIRWPEPLLEGPAWLPRRGRRTPTLVRTLDLFPTLLAATGLDTPGNDGQDLRRTLEPAD